MADSSHPEAWDKIKLREAEPKEARPEFVDKYPQAPPVFTRQLVNHDNLKEMQNLHLEAFVEPRGDPKMTIEWFKNGQPLATGRIPHRTWCRRKYSICTNDFVQIF